MWRGLLGLLFFLQWANCGEVSISGRIDHHGLLNGPIVVQAWNRTDGNRVLKLDGEGDDVLTRLTDLSGPELSIQFWFRGQSFQSAVRQQNGSLSDNEEEWSGQDTAESGEESSRGWVVAGWSGFHVLSNDGLLNGVYAGLTVPNSGWHHLALSWKQSSPGGFSGFLNGELLASRHSRDRPIPNFQVPVVLGSLNGLAEFSQGYLDEVSVWDRSFSPEEMRGNWRRRLTGDEAGLVALWRFDDGTARDSSGNDYHGQFRGDATTVAAQIPGFGAPVYSVQLDRPGPYRLIGIPSGARLNVLAFVDSNGDGRAALSEPRSELLATKSPVVDDQVGMDLRVGTLPPVWQRLWFQLLALILATGLAGLSVRFFTQQRHRNDLLRLRQQHAVEQERSRIAQDIHDELGASLTRISLLCQSAPDLSPVRDGRGIYGEIYQMVHELTRQMDEIVWAVSPRHDSIESLADYMARFAQEFLREAGVRCRLDFPPLMPPQGMSSGRRHGLFLAFKESLNNVVKHANATLVLIRLELRSDQFLLTVEDDGEGLGADEGMSAREGHGLENLRQRMEQLDGWCHIHDREPKGTVVELALELRRPRGGGVEFGLTRDRSSGVQSGSL